MDLTAKISARATNLIARRFPDAGRRSTSKHVEKFRTSGGRKRNTILGRPVFLLDVVGRTSGEVRPVMLMCTRRGDDLVVIGSAAGSDATPNWYRNLMAVGVARVQVGSDSWSVNVRQLDRGPERDECWGLATKLYPGFDDYQRFTDRQIPVAVLERQTP